MDSLMQLPKYEAYKDSGVEFLGEVPEHWETKRLKFEDNINMGQSPNSEDCNLDKIGIPFLQGNAEFGSTHPTAKLWCTKPKKTANKGDVLLSVRAPVGALNLADQKYSIGRGLTAITPLKSALTFKIYQLSYAVDGLKVLSTGSTFEAVSSSNVCNMVIPIPPLSEQTAIAAFLDRKTEQIDQAVAIKEKQISLLKERKQILIQNAITRGLDPNVPVKDSGVEWIGEIPAHWNILANRALFQERVEPGKEGLRLLSVSIHTGVSSEELSEEDNIRGRVKIEDKSKYILVKKNDITFNMMRAWQGGIGCVSVEGMVSPAYIVGMPITDLNSDYFEYQYRCPEFIQQMDRFSKGITDFRKRLYWSEFKQLLTVYPPKEEQDEIVAYIEVETKTIDKGILLQQSQIEKLKEYKTTLINSAVTGKIKVA